MTRPESHPDYTKWYDCPRCDAGYPDQCCTCRPALTPPERPSSIAAALTQRAEEIHQVSRAFADSVDDALAFLDVMERAYGFDAGKTREALSTAALGVKAWSEP